MSRCLPTILPSKKVAWLSTRRRARARAAPVSQLALRRRRGRTTLRSFPPPPIVTVFEKTSSSLLVGCLVVYFSPKERGREKRRQEGIAIPNEESVL